MKYNWHLHALDSARRNRAIRILALGILFLPLGQITIALLVGAVIAVEVPINKRSKQSKISTLLQNLRLEIDPERTIVVMPEVVNYGPILDQLILDKKPKHVLVLGKTGKNGVGVLKQITTIYSLETLDESGSIPSGSPDADILVKDETTKQLEVFAQAWNSLAIDIKATGATEVTTADALLDDEDQAQDFFSQITDGGRSGSLPDSANEQLRELYRQTLLTELALRGPFTNGTIEEVNVSVAKLIGLGTPAIKVEIAIALRSLSTTYKTVRPSPIPDQIKFVTMRPRGL